VEEVWSEKDTTPSRIADALRELLATRHRAADFFVPARVMNLIVIVDAAFRGEVENRIERVGRYHPSRLILCAVDHRRTTLDAWASVGTTSFDPRPGVLSVGRERIEIEMGPRHLRSLDTVVAPLLVTDLATMVWAPHGHEHGVDAMRRHANIVLVDSQDEDLVPALQRADHLSSYAYVVDLAWLRSTPWRERIAAAFDPPEFRRSLGVISRVVVRHRADSVAAGVLLCGWLASRLRWRPEVMSQRGNALTGHARARRDDVRLELQPLELSSPGLGGVTIETSTGESLSLDRASGGLCELRRARDGSERRFQLLGASRGESGILGEGVRQALLRDPTYRPALAAARAMIA
jgi:glucose-6-phosphate dehydrogenase assembly protein OpcA